MHGYNNNKTANVNVPLQYNIPIQGHKLTKRHYNFNKEIACLNEDTVSRE